MKILCCPDSFKESLSAFEICQIIDKSAKKIFYDVEVFSYPLADGGEGTAEIISNFLNAEKYTFKVCGPIRKEILAEVFFCKKEKIAVLDMASAAGLKLVPFEKRNPLYTTTYGVGELIKKSIELGAKTIIVGLGGSATVDAGVGCAQALGVKFYDENNEIVDTRKGACVLGKIRKIENNFLKNYDVEIISLVDVKTYLRDCVRIFGPQKGADENTLPVLEKNIENILELSKTFQIDDNEGFGAAGGLGFGLHFFCNAKIISGIEYILNLYNLKEIARNVDFIITGEGKVDAQIFEGKVLGGLFKYLREYNINTHVIIISGLVEDMEMLKKKLEYPNVSFFPVINNLNDIDYQIKHARENMEFRIESIFSFLKYAFSLKNREGKTNGDY